MVKGILVNPFSHTAEWVDIPARESLPVVYNYIDASCVDVVQVGHVFGPGHFAYVADSGLFKEGQAFTSIGGRQIAGKFLILREFPPQDEDENDDFLASATITPEEVIQRVQFVTPRYAKAAINLAMQKAAAAYAARGLSVKELGDGVILVTPMEYRDES
jgi:hypothetical protein